MRSGGSRLARRSGASTRNGGCISTIRITRFGFSLALAAWRFEQPPAPSANEGTARVEGDELIADFAIHGVEGRRPVIRERWRLTEDGRLEFSLEGGSEGERLARVGGFTAIRQ